MPKSFLISLVAVFVIIVYQLVVIRTAMKEERDDKIMLEAYKNENGLRRMEKNFRRDDVDAGTYLQGPSNDGGVL